MYFKINTSCDASQTAETTWASTIFGNQNAEKATVPLTSWLAVQISASIGIFMKLVQSVGIGAKPKMLVFPPI